MNWTFRDCEDGRRGNWNFLQLKQVLEVLSGLKWHFVTHDEKWWERKWNNSRFKQIQWRRISSFSSIKDDKFTNLPCERFHFSCPHVIICHYRKEINKIDSNNLWQVKAAKKKNFCLAVPNEIYPPSGLFSNFWMTLSFLLRFKAAGLAKTQNQTDHVN